MSMLARSTYHKTPTSSNGTTVDGYLVGIVNTSDYSPFGVQLDGRTLSDGRYRFGFNGMESDDEVSGEGNSYTAEFWQYDSRLGRRWNIDPVNKPWEGSYACFLNNPIRVIDPNGDDGYVDKDGNYLGDDGNKDSHETRVISSEEWKNINKNTSSNPKDLQKQLISSSTLLSEYSDGINISDDTWGVLEKNGGNRLTPWVENNSGHTIFVKPEHTGESNDVKPGEKVYGEVDGIAAPHLWKNKVYKTVDGVSSVITDDKLYWYSGYNPKAYTKQVLFGGLKDEAWLNKISANEIVTRTTHYWGYGNSKTVTTTKEQWQDKGWIELFKSAGIKDAEIYGQPHKTVINKIDNHNNGSKL